MSEPKQWNLDAVHAARICRQVLGALSVKARIAVLQHLLREAHEEAKTPPPPDPRQSDLFPKE